MRKHIKKYLIPHQENNHTPHLLREAGVVSLFVLITGVFGLVIGQTALIKSGKLAAVINSVLVDMTNTERTSRNLSELKVSPTLERAAALKAEDMASKSYFAHYGPDGTGPWHWFDSVGYSYLYAGENLAVNFTESEEVENAWMASDGHRANILNAYFTEIGIASRSGTYNGRPTIFVVQMFGHPKTVAVPVTQVALATPTRAPTPTQSSTPRVSVRPSTSPTLAPTPLTTATPTTSPTPVLAQVQSEQTTAPEAVVAKDASFGARMLVSPKDTLKFAYGLIGGLILFVLTLIVTSEFKKHHIKHLSYGLGLLALMGTFSYLYAAFISAVGIIS